MIPVIYNVAARECYSGVSMFAKWARDAADDGGVWAYVEGRRDRETIYTKPGFIDEREMALRDSRRDKSLQGQRHSKTYRRLE